MNQLKNPRNLYQAPLNICSECGDGRKIEACINCGLPLCPRHRVGFGAVADGYTCLGCVGARFPGCAPAYREEGRPRPAMDKWVWSLVALFIVVIGYVLGEIWKLP